ncbi:hypothetical protein GCM10018966_090300 [Streptomyces yanii]
MLGRATFTTVTSRNVMSPATQRNARISPGRRTARGSGATDISRGLDKDPGIDMAIPGSWWDEEAGTNGTEVPNTGSYCVDPAKLASGVK